MKTPYEKFYVHVRDNEVILDCDEDDYSVDITNCDPGRITRTADEHWLECRGNDGRIKQFSFVNRNGVMSIDCVTCKSGILTAAVYSPGCMLLLNDHKCPRVGRE